jgi:iron complex outermembrane receptor protein
VKKSVYLFLLFLFACAHAYGQDCAFRLTGHVHSTVAHENLVGAVVSLGGKTLVTNSNGDFRFDSLCTGTYQLTISHTSYEGFQQTVVLGKNSHLDFDLKPMQNVLTEVTITGARPPAPTGIRKELSGVELEETRGGSLAEALSKLSGVTMLQTGSTVSKPYRTRTAQQPDSYHQQRRAAGRAAMGQRACTGN